MFCSNCIAEVIESAPSPVCPLCRADIDQASMVKVPESYKGQEDEESSIQKKNCADDDEGNDEPWISSSKVLIDVVFILFSVPVLYFGNKDQALSCF